MSEHWRNALLELALAVGALLVLGVIAWLTQ
jgi:hypothetical protein